MTIEFHCPSCQKLLRTADDKAGARAKCPDCGSAVTVPSEDAPEDYDVGGGATESHDDDFDYGDDDEGYVQPTSQRQRSVRSGPSTGGDTKDCPMCGERIKAAALRCRYCGEDVEDEDDDAAPQRRRRRRGSRHSTQIDVGEVISTSWEIFKNDMGLCIGGVLLYGVMVQVINQVMQLVLGAFLPAIVGPRGGAPNFGALIVTVVTMTLIMTVITSYFVAGLQILLLNIARGTRPEIADLFRGGPFTIRFVLVGLVYGIAIMFGFVLLIVPGVILILMWWPHKFVIVDEDAPGLDSLSRAKEMTEGNWGAVFVLFFAVLGINMLGILALCVGLIFTGPLTSLMFAVAYCRMSGQRTAID